jgi:site-specific recombinase XerD
LQGRQIIQFARQKGDAPFTIPFLPQARMILEKYDGNIPVVSNQKMNDYLKDVAKTVGINKHLTTHVGRKTAGTYLLNHDVPIEVVSKILGHKSVTTTEKIYAVLLQETILRKTAHLCAA